MFLQQIELMTSRSPDECERLIAGDFSPRDVRGTVGHGQFHLTKRKTGVFSFLRADWGPDLAGTLSPAASGTAIKCRSVPFAGSLIALGLYVLAGIVAIVVNPPLSIICIGVIAGHLFRLRSSERKDTPILVAYLRRVTQAEPRAAS